MSGTAELENSRRKPAYQSASQASVLEKDRPTTGHTSRSPQLLFTSKLLNVQEASSESMDQLVEESDHLLSQLSREGQRFMDDINGSPYRRCGRNQHQDQGPES